MAERENEIQGSNLGGSLVIGDNESVLVEWARNIILKNMHIYFGSIYKRHYLNDMKI